MRKLKRRHYARFITLWQVTVYESVIGFHSDRPYRLKQVRIGMCDLFGKNE